MMHNTLRLLALVIILSTTACETMPEPIVQQELIPIQVKPTIQRKPVFKPKPVVYRPTASPILNPQDSDIIFAQTSLKALGYPIGKVDGAWGKRSETAMRSFEKDQSIESADGKLSNLNLFKLMNTHEPLKRKRTPATFAGSSLLDQTELLAQAELTQTQATNIQETSTISDQLSSTTPERNSPELIIVDHTYSILAKPNPYSATIAEIEAGTGIYVVSQQSGWYEVETMNNLRGYISDR